MAMIQATYNKYAQGACLTKYACMVWRVPHLARNPFLFVKESLLFGFSSMNQILLFVRMNHRLSETVLIQHGHPK